MGEFTDAISEAMGELQALAGSVWVWWQNGQCVKEFTPVQGTDNSAYSLIDGGTDFTRTIKLTCSKNDFTSGVPGKLATIYRKASPNVVYQVEKDNSSENDVDPTFTLELKLRHG